jgi:hypothetical protein
LPLADVDAKLTAIAYESKKSMNVKGDNQFMRKNLRRNALLGDMATLFGIA